MIDLTETDFFRIIKHIIIAELSQSRYIDSNNFTELNWEKHTNFIQYLNINFTEQIRLTNAIQRFFQIHIPLSDEIFLKLSTLKQWIDFIQIHWNKTALTFSSSGSVDLVEHYEHTLLFFTQEVSFLIQMLSDSKRIISFVPCHHFYGFLFTIILPKFLDIAVIESSIKQLASIKFQTSDLIIGTPTIWKAICLTFFSFPKQTHGISAIAPCRPEIISTLQTLELQYFTDFYISTKTGCVGYRDHFNDPYRLFPYWQHDPQSNYLLRYCQNGTILSYRLSNQLIWEDNQHFWVGKRIDTAIYIDQHCVYPEHIEYVFEQHPDIKECVVRSDHVQHLLKARIVLKDPALQEKQAFHDHFRQWIQTRLHAYEMPTSILFDSHIPKNELGKALDWPIR